MKIIITGTTSGIGEATAHALASQGHQLWLLNRNAAKSALQLQELQAKFPASEVHAIQCDLSIMASVNHALTLLRKIGPIDLLINNAGGMTPSKQISEDGIEMQFHMNHLGHFQLTMGLLPQLLEAKAKIINISSEAHRAAKLNLNNLQLEKGWSSFGAYANAKLCNILFTRALHQRYHKSGLKAYALHPGVVNTGFGNGLGVFKWVWSLMSPFLISPEKGAATTLFLAEVHKSLPSGNYFKNCKQNEASRLSYSQELIDGLWLVSEKLLEQRA
ncbi:MAG: SDR family NAD(P)-dependent oxidoreductase [Bacteroidia bacterium]